MRCRSPLFVSRTFSRAARATAVAGALVALVVGAAPACAQHEADEQAIRAAAQEYIAALERGDAQKLADFWTPDGDLIDEEGRSHSAKELVADAAAAADRKQRPTVKLIDNSIRFLTPDVAIEDGYSEVTNPLRSALPSTKGRYTAVWVKQSGKWRLATLRESRHDAGKTGQLRDLAWMVGLWSAKNGELTMDVVARWNATGTYLLRDLKVTRGDEVVFLASERIGWDPADETIKSWIFDSDGGYAEGTWTKEGDQWVIHAHGVLSDGRQTFVTNVVTYDGQNAYTRKSIGTRIGGQPSADSEMRFVRTSAPAE